MPKDTQSIEDLIASSRGGSSDDESALGQFQSAQERIKRKEIERATERLAADLGTPYISLFGFPISPEALILIDEDEARSQRVICFFYDGQHIRIGTPDPNRPAIRDLLTRLCQEYHTDGNIYLISEHSLEYALKLYGAIPKVRRFVRGVEIGESELNRFSEKFSSFKDLQSYIDKADVTDIVTMMLASAVKSGASDIHIEAEEKGIKARFRIDGVLHDAAAIDKNLWNKIISRMKLLAGVKLNVIDKPQDGRTTIYLAKDRIDIRASFLPTNYGESVVMRLLRSSSVGLAFEELGLRGRAFEQLKREVERPNGMIITTGPTGSGKTTTLYAILKKLNQSDTKIITIEDPIEYQLDGVNQSQVGKNYTFSQGLKSIVRQDPDIIMVGEVRDLETAEIAIQAALTGHLVLSTIHTNDAAGTVPRLLSMGAKPFLIAPSLNAMIGQRLVRRVCRRCQAEIKPAEEHLKRARELLEALPPEEKKNIDFRKLKFYAGKGCEACQEIGYKGRIGIYEIMTMNEEVQKLVLSGQASEYDMRNVAAKYGMVTMVQDGILKALEGITSLDEVFRVAE
jgi:type IV pilus assembly protein PilB